MRWPMLDARGWAPVVLLPLAIYLAVGDAWPPWATMWAQSLAMFFGCKWLTWRRTRRNGASIARHLGYFLGWPGLNALRFLDPRAGAVAPPRAELVVALGRMSVGLLLLFVIARQLPEDRLYLVGWTGMIGLVLALHFGIFDLLSFAWRRAGVAAEPLMDHPLRSESLGEFWGRRWNTAFRDLTFRFIFQPLSRRLGATQALFVGFVFSGIAHDIVISLPARGGYGGPTAFFILQACGIAFERSAAGRRLALTKGWRGRSFMLAALALPAPLLWHYPFVVDVIVPFMRAIGGLP